MTTEDEFAEEDALTKRLSAELDLIEPLFADAMTTAGKLLAIQKRKSAMTTPSPTPPAGEPTPVSPPLQPAPAPENPHAATATAIPTGDPWQPTPPVSPPLPPAPPQYRLHRPFFGVTAQGGPFPNYHRAGEVIETAHRPNSWMEPLNEAARQRMTGG